MSGRAPRDDNYSPLLTAVTSSSPNLAAVELYADPATHRLLVQSTISGTVAMEGDVNIAEYGGTATTLGQKARTASIPTTLATEDITALTPQIDALTDAELRATPVPVSGTVTTTPSGTQDVDVVANTIGLATGAKQDSLLTELQLKADLTDTQPVSAASLPLPSGASTAARQDTQTTELQDIEADVESTNTRLGEVQASPTANTVLDRLKSLLTELQLKADLTETQPVSAASLPLPSGAATSANQQTDGLTDTELRATPVPVSGTVAATQSGTWTEANSAAIKTAVELIDNAISGSEMQVDVVAALPAGTNAIGKLAANSGVDIGDVDVTSLPATPAGTNLIGATTPGASATVGAGTSHFRDPAVTNTAVAIKASAGKLHGYNLYNPNASLVFVHFYNVAAASVTVGTTTPLRSIALPSTANGTVGVDRSDPLGIAFGTAISVACSTTATGGTAPGTAVVVNAEYI